MPTKDNDRPQYMRCTEGFRLPGDRMVKPGDVVSSSDEMFTKYEGLARHFQPVDAGTVEAATRAPGEVRISGRSRAPRRPEGK
jgi:hypothetical protein